MVLSSGLRDGLYPSSTRLGITLQLTSSFIVCCPNAGVLVSDQRDVSGDTPPYGRRDLRAQIEALRAKLREAREHGFSPEEQSTIEALRVAIDALLGEDGI